MRSKELNLDRYNTDKITHRYLEVYDPILAPWVDKEIKLLEIGIHKGGSLQLWRDYFRLGTIIGIDVKLPHNFGPGERIQIFKGSQTDEQFLSEVARRTAPEGFDIIIDDASHIGAFTKKAFWHLFENHLKPGGLYVIEDWGTGYLDDFPDGKRLDVVDSNLPGGQSLSSEASTHNMKVPFPCHSYGMVGFIKELVDEQGAATVSMGRGVTEDPTSRFKQMIITPCIVFISKMAATISAIPNPVPTGEGLGKTTISWESANGKIFISMNGGNEALFVDRSSGSQEADWIHEGSSYEFRLYNSDHTKLLDKVVVTRSKTVPTVSASPNPVPAGKEPGKTTISWHSANGKIYVSVDGSKEVLFVDRPSGSQEVDWINEGFNYEFRLYNWDHTQLLDKIVVTRSKGR